MNVHESDGFLNLVVLMIACLIMGGLCLQQGSCAATAPAAAAAAHP